MVFEQTVQGLLADAVAGADDDEVPRPQHQLQLLKDRLLPAVTCWSMPARLVCASCPCPTCTKLCRSAFFR